MNSAEQHVPCHRNLWQHQHFEDIRFLANKIPFWGDISDEQRKLLTDPEAADVEINYNVKFKEAFDPNKTSEAVYVSDFHPPAEKQ